MTVTRTSPGVRTPRPAGARRPSRPDPRFEERRHELRRRRWLRLGLVALVAALAAGLAWLVLVSPVLGVSAVRVTGGSPQSRAEVLAAVDVPGGTPLARVDTGAAAARAAAVPLVADVQVSRAWPRTLSVSVIDRVPVVTAATDGGWALIDRTGRAYRTLGQRPPRLLLAQLDPATADPERVAALAAVAASLPPTVRSRVAHLEARSPEDVVLVLTSGSVVRWGSPRDAALKGQVLVPLLRSRARVYDVSAPDFPTTTR